MLFRDDVTWDLKAGALADFFEKHPEACKAYKDPEWSEWLRKAEAFMLENYPEIAREDVRKVGVAEEKDCDKDHDVYDGDNPVYPARSTQRNPAPVVRLPGRDSQNP